MGMLCKYTYILVLLYGLCYFANGLNNAGDSCVDNYTNSGGVCTPTNECQQTKINFEKSGIQPTFCQFDTFGPSLVCCRDNYTILQTARTIAVSRPNQNRDCERSKLQKGDPCIDNYTNTAGICTPTDECKQTKENFEKSGIQPTFCQFDAFGSSLVCCRDNHTILQASPCPVSNQKRVCEQKCEEYSRGVLKRVNYIPLLSDPEPLFITTPKCDYTPVELIIGGDLASRGEFPHMAAIGWPNFQGGYTFLCGGTLISPRFVLSAAHCLSTSHSNLQNPTPVIVRLGDQNIDPSVSDGADPIDVPIKRAYKHPDYIPPRTYDDITLFELNVGVELSASVRPACLWTRNDFGSYDKAIATGWGVTDTERDAKPSNELRKVSLSLLSNDYCDPLLSGLRSFRWDGFRSTQMCAGELLGKKDTCQGDSGGPIQVVSLDNHCIFHVIGVTSFGQRCADSGKPAIYTRVSSYLDWIEQIVWPGE